MAHNPEEVAEATQEFLNGLSIDGIEAGPALATRFGNQGLKAAVREMTVRLAKALFGGATISPSEGTELYPNPFKSSD